MKVVNFGAHTTFNECVKTLDSSSKLRHQMPHFRMVWPNALTHTYGDMMWSMLNAAQLGPEYWSWALLHAVYLKTHMPHRAIGITPYQAYTGKKPNLKHLRIFGSPVISRLPGRRPAKLDSHTSGGIFLGFTATSHNIYYRDSETKCIKIATHITFDEAGYSVPTHAQTPSQQALQ